MRLLARNHPKGWKLQGYVSPAYDGLTTGATNDADVVGGDPALGTKPGSFKFFRFFELPTKADTETGSADKSCFLSGHIQAPPVERIAAETG